MNNVTDEIKKAMHETYEQITEYLADGYSDRDEKNIKIILTELVESVKPKESAWEMFRRLWFKAGIIFANKIIKLTTPDESEYDLLNAFVCLSCFVRDKSEPEAIQIMQAIEKELEGENDKSSIL